MTRPSRLTALAGQLANDLAKVGMSKEGLGDKAAMPAVAAKTLVQAGIIRPHSPKALAQVALALQQWGVGLVGGFKSVSLRYPDRVGLVDERGELTFGQIEERSDALAVSLAELGVGEGDSVAVLIRNHRGFLEASLGAAKLGADVLYLNTAFAAPQLGEVCEREKPTVIIYDQEFTGLIDDAGIKLQRVLAWVDEDGDSTGEVDDLPTLDGLIDKSMARHPERRPERQARAVILTSGTTGTPKGAPRGNASIGAAVSLLSRMPLKSGWRCHIAAPLFHTWGWAHLNLAMLLGTTVVLTRRFDPEDCLRILQDQKCDSVVVIPVMMQRILKLHGNTLNKYDLPHLKATAASGSALPGDLATDWMDRFGDNLYNIYGSTEVAWVTIAQPRDMREAPGTAGKPPIGTIVKLFDSEGTEVPAGETGRIFVGNSMLFEGYTGGGHKDVIDGLMSSGDVGRFDRQGRLFVEGRDDEMIVSGGENVFPQEVEDVISRHESVQEVAAIGVEDEDFGKRLRAFVVLKDGAKASEDDLKDHVKKNLARYKVPRDVVFLDELPRNATGKILKRKLADPED